MDAATSSPRCASPISSLRSHDDPLHLDYPATKENTVDLSESTSQADVFAAAALVTLADLTEQARRESATQGAAEKGPATTPAPNAPVLEDVPLSTTTTPVPVVTSAPAAVVVVDDAAEMPKPVAPSAGADATPKVSTMEEFWMQKARAACAAAWKLGQNYLSQLDMYEIPASRQAAYRAALAALAGLRVRESHPALRTVSDVVKVATMHTFAGMYTKALSAFLRGRIMPDGVRFACCSGVVPIHNDQIPCVHYHTLLDAVDNAMRERRAIFGDMAPRDAVFDRVRCAVRGKVLEIMAPMRAALRQAVPLNDLRDASGGSPLKRSREAPLTTPPPTCDKGTSHEGGDGADLQSAAAKRMRPLLTLLPVAKPVPAAVAAPSIPQPHQPALASANQTEFELYMYIPALRKALPVKVPASAMAGFHALAAAAVKQASSDQAKEDHL